MNDISDNNWFGYSDKMFLVKIGEFVKFHRLNQNKTQEILAFESGISRSTLNQLEKGETVTTLTLIQVLRVLGKLNIIESFIAEKPISPLALAKLQKTGRKRARTIKNNNQQITNW